MSHFQPCPKPAPRVKTPKPLQRGKRINPRNEERAAERLERDYGPVGYADWIRSCACCVSGSAGSKSDPIVFAHAKSRGAGGDWRSGVPMLASLHQEQHDAGIETFQARYGVDLQMIADAHVMRWRQFTKSEVRADGYAGSGA